MKELCSKCNINNVYIKNNKKSDLCSKCYKSIIKDNNLCHSCKKPCKDVFEILYKNKYCYDCICKFESLNGFDENIKKINRLIFFK